MEQETFAAELLHLVKQQAKHWFVAFIVVLILWFATIGVFIWYVSLPVEEYEITQTSDSNSENQIIGGNYYGE